MRDSKIPLPNQEFNSVVSPIAILCHKCRPGEHGALLSAHNNKGFDRSTDGDNSFNIISPAVNEYPGDRPVVFLYPAKGVIKVNKHWGGLGIDNIFIYNNICIRNIFPAYFQANQMSGFGTILERHLKCVRHRYSRCFVRAAANNERP